MNKVKVGVIGCGMISKVYMTNMTSVFSDYLDVVACADIKLEAAEALADAYGIQTLSMDDVLLHPEIELIVNLTIPSAHYEVAKKALLAGKHVYTEKPLATEVKQGKELIALAKEKALVLACAPDTYLGAGFQTCKRLIDEGQIGKPIAAYGFMLGRGPESFHPNPAFFYQAGGGPLYDIGPYYFTTLAALFGPALEVYGTGKRISETRKVKSEASPLYNTDFPCDVNTFENIIVHYPNQVVANITTTWDVPFPYWESRLPQMIVYGDNGYIVIPDPNTYGGVASSPFTPEPGKVIYMKKGTEPEKEIAVDPGYLTNSRGIGPASVARAIRKGKRPDVSGELALNVLEAMHGVEESSKTKKSYQMQTSFEPLEPFYLFEKE